MSKALDALTTITAIQNKQTAQIVELAIAFGMSRVMADHASVSTNYSTHDVVDFLKQHDVEVGEGASGTTRVVVTRKE